MIKQFTLPARECNFAFRAKIKRNGIYDENGFGNEAKENSIRKNLTPFFCSILRNELFVIPSKLLKSV